MSYIEITRIVFLLMAGHALGDFALQNEWMATNKNRHVRLSLSAEMREKTQIIWPYLLSSHAFIHGLLVYLITGKTSLGIAETFAHWITDFSKCERWFDFHTDQLIHVITKLLWAYLFISEASILF